MTESTRPSDYERSIDVLLVEDNPGDVRLTREAFKAATVEHTLHVVTTGDDAIDFLAQRREYANACYPDLVLLDLNLPGKDGPDVLEAIRDNPAVRCLPVIMLTSSTAQEDIVECYEATANAYLTKPSDPDEFASRVAAVDQFWVNQVELPPIPYRR